MDAYASVGAKVRFFEDTTKSFETIYPLESYYKSTQVSHFTFLRHIDTATASFLTNPTVALTTPFVTTIHRAVNALRRESKSSVNIPGGPVSWMPSFSAAVAGFTHEFLRNKASQDPLSTAVIFSYDILWICNLMATTETYILWLVSLLVKGGLSLLMLSGRCVQRSKLI